MEARAREKSLCGVCWRVCGRVCGLKRRRGAGVRGVRARDYVRTRGATYADWRDAHRAYARVRAAPRTGRTRPSLLAFVPAQVAAHMGAQAAHS